MNGTGSSNTGPTVNGGADHNPGIAGGKYLYTESSASAGYPNAVALLESPWFDLIGLPAAQLDFWYNMYGQSMGTLEIEVRTGMSDPWTTLVAPFTDDLDNWQLSSTSLSAYTAEDSVQFRWHGITGTNFYSDMAIDDVSVYEPAQVDLVTVSLDTVATGCGLGMEDVFITVEEAGSTGLMAGDTIFAYFDNGVTVINDTFVLPAPFPPGIVAYQFSQLADFTALGAYNVTVSVYTSADPDNSNDSLFTTITSIPLVSTYPHLEDFELGPGGWVVDNGTNGNWQFGDPVSGPIIGAASGDSCFVTGLNTFYNSNTSGAFVESPCFDLTAATGTEQVAMSIFRETEDSWDGANMTYSMDGITWTLLGNFGDPNWYTDNSINGAPGGSQEGWEGSSNGWHTTKHALPDTLFTQTGVRFRVNFGSDGSVQQAGFAFDNFAIANGPAFSLADSIIVCDTLLGAGVDPGVWESYLWDTGETTQLSSSTAGGLHWVEVTGIYGTCTRDTVIVILSGAVPPNLQDELLICYPSSTELVAGTDTLNTYTYVWSTAETTSSISVNTAGVYTVIKTDSSGTCVMNDTLTLTVAQVDFGQESIAYCVGSEPTLDAGPGGVSYLWNTNDTTQMITPSAPGAYAVTVVDTNGCVLIDAIDLMESIPTVDIGGDQTICVYNSSMLDAGTQTSYLWSDASTGQTVFLDGAALGLGTHNYDVTVTDSIGCTATDMMVLTVDGCASITELDGMLFDVFPNPSEGTFNYELSELTGDTQMIVTDLSGKIVLNTQITATTGSFDLSNVETGVYILTLSSENGTASVRLMKK